MTKGRALPCDNAVFADGTSTRAIDLRYLARHPATNARPYFAMVWQHAQATLIDDPIPSLLDVGCANGAFVHYALSHRSDLHCVGIDALGPLIEAARALVPDADFAVGDILRRDTLPTGRFSVVTVLTLHSHFDDINLWLSNAIGLGRPGGKVLIYGPFNRQPVDVLVRVRAAADRDGPWLPGWNLHSREAFASNLDRRGLRYAFHDYVPKVATSACADPLRSHSALLDGEPVFTNGAGLVLRFALLEIFL
jgi:SAM-dependent methyltransferase